MMIRKDYSVITERKTAGEGSPAPLRVRSEYTPTGANAVATAAIAFEVIPAVSTHRTEINNIMSQ